MRFVILNIVGLVVFGMSAYYTMKNLKRKAWDIAMLSFGMCLALAPVNVLALVAAACDWTGTRLPLPIESFFRYIFDMDLSRSSAHFGLVIPERMQVVSVSNFVLTVLLSKEWTTVPSGRSLYQSVPVFWAVLQVHRYKKTSRIRSSPRCSTDVW